jgi:hypothetical protein
MAHQNKSELLNTVLQLLNDEGTSGLAEGLRLLINGKDGKGKMARERWQGKDGKLERWFKLERWGHI